MPFDFRPLRLPGMTLVRAKRMGDARGWLQETYKRSAFVEAGIAVDFLQDNLSRTSERGTVRGLHFQIGPMIQGKLVRCARGRIFDVGVDLRRGSPTYGQWDAVVLAADSEDLLWVGPGFAHAFQTLEDDCIVAYKATAEYSAPHERGLRWNDPTVGIHWPIAAAIVNDRDAAFPFLSDVDADLRWAGR